MSEYFLVSKTPTKEGEKFGRLQLPPGAKMFGDVQVPPQPIDISVSERGELFIRPSRDGAITSAQKETAVEGSPNDTIEPLSFENQAIFQEIGLSKRSNLRIKGNDGSTIMIYP